MGHRPSGRPSRVPHRLPRCVGEELEYAHAKLRTVCTTAGRVPQHDDANLTITIELEERGETGNAAVVTVEVVIAFALDPKANAVLGRGLPVGAQHGVECAVESGWRDDGRRPVSPAAGPGTG